ncbi:hypothetical protein BRADI_2g59124v3 [Brachypodium distachyon]|uniref:Uncharacterized protein n=1 Tax=Brachypodium distachyon TaxID=15368 RepID=A0A2K2DGU3_BRADI|nr:hypothetical protein BRADI_2g59124v3 [Brachypodium distachyon]
MWVRAVAGDLNLADQAAHIQGWWRGKSRLERAGLGDRALATMMPTSALGSRRPRALASSCGKREHAPLTHGHSPAVLAALAGRQRMQEDWPKVPDDPRSMGSEPDDMLHLQSCHLRTVLATLCWKVCHFQHCGVTR